MKRYAVITALTLIFFISSNLLRSGMAQQTASPSISGGRSRALPDFDIRAGLYRENRRGGKMDFRLLRERPQTQIRWSSLTQTPIRVFNLQQNLSATSGEDPEIISKRFLSRNQDLFRIKDADVAALRVVGKDRTAHNGVTHLTLQQEVNGIEVFKGRMTFHIDRNGEAASAGGELIPDAKEAVNIDSPGLTSNEALSKALEYVKIEDGGRNMLKNRSGRRDRLQTFAENQVFSHDVEARLVYFPLAADQLRLAWEITLWLRGGADDYLVLIDAERGTLLHRYNLTWHCFEAAPFPFDPPVRFVPFVSEAAPSQTAQAPSGLVYTRESPRPGAAGSSGIPPFVERESRPFDGSAVFAANDPHFSWWAREPATGLVGNNADARLDRDGNDLPDAPRLAVANGDFTFPIDFTQQPTTENNQKSALVNLFYWANRYHDMLYPFGFNEMSGNFQKNNFNLGGLGNDPILADAQDGYDLNNASYSGGRDGSPGRVEMFLWTGGLMLDGDLDQSVIIHELTHGMSTRLVGNGDGLSGIQGRGMGEGWSDFFGLALLRAPEDDLDGSYAIGQYPTSNYFRGIRRFPYSTNPQVYPLNFGDIKRNPQIHAIGEIWCNTLWEMRALLIKNLGFEQGQRQSIQLAVDGMKLTLQTAPTFLDARDAIIEADRLNNGGANRCTLWQAFAKRGMGHSASTSDSSDASPQEAFDTPPYCSDLGIIRLDQSNYLSGETIKITIGDRNASAPVRIRALSSVTNDEETITLTPDQAFQGSFNAGLRVMSGEARPGDGVMQASVSRRDKITIIYQDQRDGSGNPVTVTAEAKATGEKVVFEDWVERGNSGWISSGSPVPAWSIFDESGSGGSHVWTDSPGGNYSNNTDASLTSPLLDFSNAAGAVLVFSHRFSLEKGLDYAIVEFSTDDGETWKKAAAFTGLQLSYVQSEVTIDALAGSPRARLRFRILTDGLGSADGWSIDDIRIIARCDDVIYLPNPIALSPSIAGVTPAFGPPQGNTEVKITGSNFTDADDVKVFFDGLPASDINVFSGSGINVRTPAHAAGAVGVRIETRNGSATVANGFTYFVKSPSPESPELKSLNPTSGTTRGGTAVILHGNNFTPETTVNFGPFRAEATFINSNTLRAIAPASAGGAAGAVDVTVATSPSAQSKLANGFNYAAPKPPALELMTLNGGEKLFAGSTITIHWQSSDDGFIAKHRIEYFRNSLSSPQVIADNIQGTAQSFNWFIPASIASSAQSRIRITAIDDEGAETRVISAGDLSIAHRWESSSNLSRATQRGAMASDGKYLYYFGGRTTNASSSTIAISQRMDPSAEQPSWSSSVVPQMPKALNAIEAVYLDGAIYIPGGVNQQSDIDSSHFVLDTTLNFWTSKASPPTRSILYALAADSEKGVYYMTGGSTDLGPVSNVQIYDPRTNLWTQVAGMQTARSGHESTVIGGKLYVAGGVGTIGGLAGCEVFDPALQRWAPIAPLSRPRRHAINAVAKDARGKIFWLIIGGEDPNNGAPIHSVEAYDPESDRWRTLDASFSPPAPRTQLGAAIHNGYLYAAGGVIQVSGSNISSPATERLKLDAVETSTMNLPPALVAPHAAQTGAPSQELAFEVLANDLSSGVPISIFADGLPEGAAFKVVNETNNSARGVFRWTPAESDRGKAFALKFTATDGELSDVKTVIVRVVAAGPLAAVNAADFRIGPLAKDSIAAAFGSGLASTIEAASSLPLPLSIAGTTLTVNGAPAPLFFVSPTQINFVTPASIETGKAIIIVTNPQGEFSSSAVEILDSAPGIFTANSTGSGDAAAQATTDGVTYQSPPFDVIINGKPNILILYGTGIRRANAANPNDENGVAESVTVSIDGKAAKVLYAGAQGSLSGLDQINVELPAGLANGPRRRVELVMTVNGTAANRVTIEIK